MSTPSRTSTPKISTQSLQKSGWARGPPQRSTSPTVTSTSASPTRSQSPGLPPQSVTTHARQPNAVGRRGFTIGDGINVPFRDNVGISKQSRSRFIRIDSVSWRPNGARLRCSRVVRKVRDTGPVTSPFLRMSDILFSPRFDDFWVSR